MNRFTYRAATETTWWKLAASVACVPLLIYVIAVDGSFPAPFARWKPLLVLAYAAYFVKLALQVFGQTRFTIVDCRLEVRAFPLALRTIRLRLQDILGIQAHNDQDSDGDIAYYTVVALLRDGEPRVIVPWVSTSEHAVRLAARIEAMCTTAKSTMLESTRPT